jgi:hypothetical protein
MRRALTLVALLMLAMAMVAPAAQGKRTARLFQDLDTTGPLSGQIFLTVVYQDRHGNGKFKPKWVGYILQTAVSCNPGGISGLTVLKGAASLDSQFKARVTKGRFATRLESGVNPAAAPPYGDLTGKVSKGRIGKGRVSGSFNVADWDPNPGSRENCVAGGSFSATPCKAPDPRYSHLDVPICDNLRG